MNRFVERLRTGPPVVADGGMGALISAAVPRLRCPEEANLRSPESVISVHVGSGVDEAYAEAKRRGYEIVHPLTEEAWGVRRFFVRAPDGNVINVVSHSDE